MLIFKNACISIFLNLLIFTILSSCTVIKGLKISNLLSISIVPEFGRAREEARESQGTAGERAALPAAAAEPAVRRAAGLAPLRQRHDTHARHAG